MQPPATPVPAATLPRELRPFLDLLNQVFEIEKKVAALTESNSIGRNLNRMTKLARAGVGSYERWAAGYAQPHLPQPAGRSLQRNPHRLRCQHRGGSAENLVITEVIKPIVWLSLNRQPGSIVQQAVGGGTSQDAALPPLPTPPPQTLLLTKLLLLTVWTT
ncbi:MAG: hypothetical protein WKG07_43875 [Hymenobacter sp.]